MQPREATKLVEIEGESFQLSRMNPLVGSYIVGQLFTRLAPHGIEQAIMQQVSKEMGVGAFELPANRQQMEMSEWIQFQVECLRVCAYFEPAMPTVPIPIIRADG